MICLRKAMYVASVWVAGAFCCGEATAIEGPDAQALSLVRLAVEGMQHERARLLSGRCHFKGEYYHRFDVEPHVTLSGPTEGMIAFEQGKLRFDLSRPDMVVDAMAVDPASDTMVATTKPGTSTKRHAVDGSRAMTWHSDDSQLAIVPMTQAQPSRVTDYVDVWAMTLYDRYSIAHGFSVEEVFERLLQAATVATLGVTDEAGRLRIEWIDDLDTHLMKVTLAVDVDSGFTPVMYRLERRPTEGTEWVVEWENQTEWECRDGVWVPIRQSATVFQTAFERRDGQLIARPPRVAFSQTYDFDWITINQPVDSELFSYTTFGLPDHVGVQDLTGAEPKWIKQPGPRPAAWRGRIVVIASLFLVGLSILGFFVRQLVREEGGASV